MRTEDGVQKGKQEREKQAGKGRRVGQEKDDSGQPDEREKRKAH